MNSKTILAAIMAGMSAIFVSFAADTVIDTAKNTPCDSLTRIIDALRQHNFTNIVSLEAKDDCWVAESIDQDGKRHQVIVNCQGTDTSAMKFKGPYEMNAPPKTSKSIGQIINLAEMVTPGTVKEVTFRDGRWSVGIVDKTNIETTVHFDANGVLLTTTQED